MSERIESMKKFFKSSVLVAVLASQVGPALADQKKITDFFKPIPRVAHYQSARVATTAPSNAAAVHGGALAPTPPSSHAHAHASPAQVQPVSMNAFPPDVLTVISSQLDARSRLAFAQTHKEGLDAATIAHQEDFKREYAKLNLIALPAVTERDVEQLTAGVAAQEPRASSIHPMAGFKISDTPVTIGLYHSVMGRYPDLGRSDTPRDLGPRRALLQSWLDHPDLPLTNTTLAEDQAFVVQLNAKIAELHNKLPHRYPPHQFRIPTESEVEYAIRGRTLVAGGETGAITATKYYFGDNFAEVKNRGWIHGNSGIQAHGVREPLPGRPLSDSKNAFGLIHAIGNVWIRSSEGVVRGGSFRDTGNLARSLFRDEDNATGRFHDVGLRLVEDL